MNPKIHANHADIGGIYHLVIRCLLAYLFDTRADFLMHEKDGVSGRYKNIEVLGAHLVSENA
jgi:hypothetical protein|tara:strand:- start:64 stop:249 length:186 start_codon:yes stop_codon:yes gene_type:complete